MIPYARHQITEDDLAAVLDALQSGWLTTGPLVEAFEGAVCEATGASHGVATSSGTAALHCAMFALGIGPGDEVVVPALTFAATANCVAYMGATPVFAEVDPDTMLLDPGDVVRRITPRTRAIIAVDYAGQPCDYAALRTLAEARGLALVADACHSLGGATAEGPVGVLADVTVFSFHPAKHVTTAEGGMLVCLDPDLAARARRFRNHGIDLDARERGRRGVFAYQMTDLGFNYRLSDIHCALGLSQLKRLPGFLEDRRRAAEAYGRNLAGLARVSPLAVRPGVSHAYHLYVVRVDFQALRLDRQEAFRRLHQAGVGANVHYLPVHLHPYYRGRLGTGPGALPVTEAAYERLLSLPMFNGITRDMVERVCSAVHALETGRG